MTPATSVTFFKPEFGDFLYAPVGGGAEDMTTTVMSALARLGLDPWQEASELTELSSDAAAARLSALLVRLPLAQRSLVVSKTFISSLVELLPRHLQVTAAIPPLERPVLSTVAPNKILIIAALAVGIIFSIIASQTNTSPVAVDREVPAATSPTPESTR